MKRLCFTFVIFVSIFAALPCAKADVDVSIDFFYENLADEGNWIDVADYGYCWQPSVAVNDSSWRPYADGYWAYTDVGWTWVSYEPFGWATYHYGRWARLADYGWVWVPGTEWGPAWVSWRTGGDYVGWAPLPPRHAGGGEVIYEGRPITARVDIEFNIGPAYYNFCDMRYFGEPVLRHRLFAPTQNITYINQTVNVTNITYSNAVVYNYGPDYNRLSAYSTRPIQRLRLQREANVDFNTAAKSGAFARVQGDQFLVGAPQRLERRRDRGAPKVVKAKVERPNIETGWMGITDPKAKAEIQQKMKTEDSKSVPPPQVQPVRPEALTAAQSGGSPAPTGNPAMGTPPIAGSTPPVATASPAAGSSPPVTGGSPAGASPAPTVARDAARETSRQPTTQRPAQPTATPPSEKTMPETTTSPAGPTDQLRERDKEKTRRGPNKLAQPSVVPETVATPPPEATQGAAAPPPNLKGKEQRLIQPMPTTAPPAPQADRSEESIPRSEATRPQRPAYVPTLPDASAPSTAPERKLKPGRADVPAPEAIGGTTSGPTAPQDVPRPVDRQMRQRPQIQPQVPPQQVAPAGPVGVLPQGQPRSEGKPKKEKKGDEPASSPAQPEH